jgi:hypothetical protein
MAKRQPTGVYELVARLEALDREREDLKQQIIDALGGDGGGAVARPARGRPRGSGTTRRGGGGGRSSGPTLVDALAKVLAGRTLSVSEVTDSLKAAGYPSKSPNLRTMVNAAVIKFKSRFKRVSRGKYTAR